MNTILISAPNPSELKSYMALCTAGERDGDGSCFDDTVYMTSLYEGFSLNNGDVSTSYARFALSTDENGINIDDANNANNSPFLSLDVSESVFDVDDIRYVGVQSHDGTDGLTSHASDWIFYTDGNYY